MKNVLSFLISAATVLTACHSPDNIPNVAKNNGDISTSSLMLDLATQIPDLERQSDAFIQCAEISWNTGRTNLARVFLRRSANCVRGLRDRDSASYQLARVSKKQMDFGLLDEALATARLIPIRSDRHETIGSILIALVREGRIAQAMAISRMMPSSLWANQARISLVEHLVDAGKLDIASEATLHIPKTSLPAFFVPGGSKKMQAPRDEAIYLVCMALIKNGQAAKAASFAGKFHHSAPRNVILAHAANALTAARQHKQSLEFIKTITDKELKSKSQLALVKSMTSHGYTDPAFAVADDIALPEIKSKSMAIIAGSVFGKNHERGKELFTKSVQIAETQLKSVTQFETLVFICGQLAECHLFNETEGVLEIINKANKTELNLLSLAEKLMNNKNSSGGVTLAKKILADDKHSVWNKSWEWIAWDSIEGGDLTLLEQLQKKIKIPDQKQRDRIRKSWAIKLQETGHTRKALNYAMQIKSVRMKTEALAKLAQNSMNITESELFLDCVPNGIELTWARNSVIRHWVGERKYTQASLILEKMDGANISYPVFEALRNSYQSLKDEISKKIIHKKMADWIMAAPASTNYLTSNSRAIICAQIGQEKLAEHLFSMAVENAQTGGSLWSQVQGLSTIARSQIQCGFKKQGRANLRSALQLGVNESLVIIEMIDAGMLEQAQSAFNSLRKKDGKSRQGSELRLRLAIACAERGHFQDSIKYAIGIKDIDIRQYTFFNMAAIHCTFGSGKIDHDEFRPYLLQLADRKFKAAFSFEESKHAKAIFSASKYSKTIE